MRERKIPFAYFDCFAVAILFLNNFHQHPLATVVGSRKRI